MRLAHLADVHVGMTNAGHINPATGINTRIEDFERALNQVVTDTIAAKVDAVIFAGDAFRTREPSTTERVVWHRVVDRWVAAGIPVVMVTGNHDMHVAEGRASALATFRDREHEGIYLAEAPRLITLRVKDAVLDLVCMPYPYKSAYPAGADSYPVLLDSLLAKCNSDSHRVLVSHLTVLGAMTGSEQQLTVQSDTAIPINMLKPEQFIYTALGHIHRHQHFEHLHPHGRRVVYSGSLEHIDHGEAKLQKGWIEVDTVTGEWQFKPVYVRPFATISIDLRSGQPLEFALRDAIEASPVTEDTVLRLMVTTNELRPHVSSADVARFLPKVHHLAVAVDVERAPRRRNLPLLKDQRIEELDKVQLLELWMRSKDMDEDQVKELMDLARDIMSKV